MTGIACQVSGLWKKGKARGETTGQRTNDTGGERPLVYKKLEGPEGQERVPPGAVEKEGPRRLLGCGAPAGPAGGCQKEKRAVMWVLRFVHAESSGVKEGKKRRRRHVLEGKNLTSPKRMLHLVGRKKEGSPREGEKKGCNNPLLGENNIPPTCT